MTWHTQIGDRVLEGIEAKFYLEILQEAVYYLQEIEDFNDELECLTEDNIFDNANFNQKIVLLHSCLVALLNPDVPPPSLTNSLEAAAFFPFAFLQMKVEEEINLAEDGLFEEGEDYLKYCYRQRLWSVFEQLILPSWQAEEFDDDEEEYDDWSDFDYHSTDVEQWKWLVDELADRIFWDRDWQFSSEFPQLLDGIEPEFSQTTGIYEDYMSNRLPKVTPEEAKTALLEIQTWSI
ncbi:hypothetical protein IQ259_19445 [Fortiea sp. LEGE XX443]|uniref:hypothetical protein n=1 Tax=Fortiea sp. LEGE XX443 TaxID=1828611 RepID=UPI0018808810|nr:hypothetical protein [Fortiea sp. LEGE XX443]MBE9007181.1 hypothetical protein [Fortiea sp. LEGE XX443]